MSNSRMDKILRGIKKVYKENGIKLNKLPINLYRVYPTGPLYPDKSPVRFVISQEFIL